MKITWSKLLLMMPWEGATVENDIPLSEIPVWPAFFSGWMQITGFFLIPRLSS